MANQTNINNNSRVVNVGRTTPISPGPQEPDKSIPVVVSNTAELAVPVIEQQKIQSEVALSLLGIPRGEVALGIFSDVNTYDVNPTEWSKSPAEYTPGHGVKHLPQEAGALVQAGPGENGVLSSKRFFRYQPGRVSSATFGVKCTKSPSQTAENPDYNPSRRKFGIFDNYDGYYWEVAQDGKGDNFSVVRRTQSLLYHNPVLFNNLTTNNTDYRVSGKAPVDIAEEPNAQPLAISIISDNRFILASAAFDRAIADNPGAIADYLNAISATDREKCLRDMDFAISAYNLDLQYNGDGYTSVNSTTYRTALLPAGGSARAAEQAVHTALGVELKAILNTNDIDLDTKIDTLVAIQTSAVGGTQLDATAIQNIDYGDSTKIKTIFEIYKRYYGYLITESFSQANYVDYIKYKCYRDIGYIMDGYGRDLDGGGNAGTTYNAQNFYFNDVLRVSTNFGTDNEVIPFHIKAHTLLKNLLTDNSFVTNDALPDTSGNWNMNTAILRGASAGGFSSLMDLFQFDDATRARLDELTNVIIDNFTTPWAGTMEFGNREQFGDAFIMRDGLLHVHAGLYDPSLLKPEKRIRVQLIGGDTLKAAEGEYVEDQIVIFSGDVLELGVYDAEAANVTDSDGNPEGRMFAIKNISGKRNNEFQLYLPTDTTKATVTFTQPADGNGNYAISNRAPFFFPDVYVTGTNQRGSETTTTTWAKADGHFPYMYTNSTGIETDSLGNTRDEGLPVDGDTGGLYALGYINTAIDTTSASISILKQQVDAMNYAYNNWVKQNVDPKYYSVYEYRVPRSRFSQDKLDGQIRNQVYSDVATGEFQGTNGVVVRAGQSVTENEEQKVAESQWDIDFGNVIMLKIEFSWYGAVGALFLAYVPVGNGEARWVRVHHLRCSNQLKISSLGNATLPITYNVYGGGTDANYGSPNVLPSAYSGPYSDYIVKYGASYYIDGGDRGTVRLYSHTNLQQTVVQGNQWTIPGVPVQGTDAIGNFITLPSVATFAPEVTDRTFFMKSQLTTNNILDQGVTITWVDGNKLYTSAPLQGTFDMVLYSKRPSVVFGLKAKEQIQNNAGVGIRNRVQVYPTKLSAGNFGATPLKLQIMKTPLFQNNITSSGTFTTNAAFLVAATPAPLPTASLGYFAIDGQFKYGWFVANVGTVFGKLERKGGQYYFELLDVYNEDVILLPSVPFLPDGVYSTTGAPQVVGTVTSVDQEKERLSSVRIANTITVPIPDTGSEVTSLFVAPGSEQFDLLAYFDYNKDYLSYPLTDEIESIYLVGMKPIENGAANTSNLNLSMTWEEQ